MRSRWLHSLFAFAGILAAARPVAAESPDPGAPTVAPGPHRIRFGIGAAAALTGIGDDGHYDAAGAGSALRVGYHFAVFSWLEVGAAASYWYTNSALPHVWMVGPELRASYAFGSAKRFELGLTIRAGYAGMRYVDQPDDMTNRDVVWRGVGYGLGPDARLWVSDRVGLGVGFELTAVNGKSVERPPSSYIEERGGFAALTAWSELTVAF